MLNMLPPPLGRIMFSTMTRRFVLEVVCAMTSMSADLS